MLSRFKFHRDVKNDKGMALIIVLMVVTTLTILVLEFIHSTRINLYISSNIADGLKAFNLAKSGVMVAAGAMLDDIQDSTDDHLEEDWALPLPALPGGEGWVTVEIFDESSKLNLNMLVRKSGLPDTVRQEVFRTILTDMQLDPELINAVIDWVDEDEESQLGGDELSAYGYQALPDPYPVKNGPLTSLNELTLINGITDDIYNKIKPYVTIYGDVKLNLNTVDEKVLNAYIKVLSGKDDSDAGEKIIAWRNEEGNHFSKKKIKQQLTTDVEIEPGLAKNIIKHFGTQSRYFSVVADAVVAESTKRAIGILQRTQNNVKIIYFRPM